jgi:hypothetical protein
MPAKAMAASKAASKAAVKGRFRRMVSIPGETPRYRPPPGLNEGHRAPLPA